LKVISKAFSTLGIFKLPKSIWALAITFILLVGIAPTVFAGDTNTDLGKWQTNVQRGAGKGDTYKWLPQGESTQINMTKVEKGLSIIHFLLYVATCHVGGTQLKCLKLGDEVQEFLLYFT
jgi:hypothetical protein